MAYTSGLSKEGKRLFNSSEDWELIKDKISAEDKLKLDENIKKEAIKAMKQLNKIMQR
jgi:hypothetical protein